jgi:N-acetylglucosamine malate deacetylase 2
LLLSLTPFAACHPRADEQISNSRTLDNMANSVYSPTRKQFLKQIGGLALVFAAANGAASQPKLLIVVAHPDDEYMFAATTYRMVRELGWTADQVVITNGEAGYRYASLAEPIYGTRLAEESNGRARLPAIRREEVLRAGKILGIRKHFFLDQKDSGFTSSAADADASNWDRSRISRFLLDLLSRERYDAVFTVLPTPETHGHHRAATILALEAVSRLNEDGRPLVFGVEADSEESSHTFEELASEPLTATFGCQPVIAFDRNSSFGYHHALNYQIVVNWVIAEHKSQGLFQNDAGKNQFEHFWLFQVSGPSAPSRLERLRQQLLTNINKVALR